MKKKIYISFLTLVFFVSTTSLPLTISLCRMSDMNSACSMCGNEKLPEGSVVVKNDMSCCSQKVVDNSVKDNFLFQKTSSNDSKTGTSSTVVEIPIQNIFSSRYSLTRNFTYPPPELQSNETYLFNSVLLI